MPVSEGETLAACIEYLAVRQIFAWRNNSGAIQVRPGQFMRFGIKGSADIIGVLPDGRFLAVEVKSAKGQLSDEQKRFLETIAANGGLAIVARSIDDIETVLKQEGYI
jgi:hypothetical protein